MNTFKINSFKAKLLRLFAVALALSFLTLVINVSADNVSDLQDKKADIKTQTQNAQDFLNDTKTEKSNVMNEVLLLDVQLDDATQKLDETNAKLDETNKSLEEAQADLEEATALRETQYENLRERLVYMYESSTTGYIEIILQSKNFIDLINRVEYVDTIINYDNDLLLGFAETEARISLRISEIETAKSALVTLQTDQDAQKQSLEDAVSEKNKRILELMSNEVSLQQQLFDLDEADRNVERLIKEAEAESARLAAEKEAAARASRNSSSQPQTKYTSGVLSWPVPGYYSRSSEYNSRTNPISGLNEFHTGIDIPSPAGTNIVAAGSGVVIMSSYNGGYGYCVVIDHGDGLTTLYGHNSKLLVEYGDYVTAGQAIANCGSTGYSTGPHCHFEVRVNGSHTSPLNYLN